MSDQQINRKLAAILAADVAGYSRLMHQDEEATLRRLNEYRGVTDSIIASRGGRIANTAGDSILAEFASPVEAVRAALEIQEALNTRNAALPAEQRMELRIGVNLGDVMVKDGDLLGDGVNVAARLQTIAPAGGVCVSASIHDQIEGKLTLQFRDMGQQSLKNIARPVRAFSVAPGGASRALRAGRGSRLPLYAAAAMLLLGGGAAAAWFGGAFRDTSPARFDGVWQGTYHCAPAGASSEVNRPAVVVVRNGALSYSAGLPNQPNSFAVSGAVRGDDTIELAGTGVSPNGASYPHLMSGRFSGEQLSIASVPTLRPCELQLARQRNADVASVQRAIDDELARRAAEVERLRRAELDKQKADADAARLAAEKAKADADTAKAAADAAKAKADADAAAAAKARAEAEKRNAAPPPPGAAAPPQAATTPPAKAPVGRLNRFDGVWRGEFTCAAGGTDNRPATDVARLVRIKNGEMVLESGGRQGQPRTYRAVGTIQDDDTVDLRGPGVTQKGSAFDFHLVGKFSGDSFSGNTVLSGRPCKLTLTREK